MTTIEFADWRDQYAVARRATVAYLRLIELVYREHYDDHEGPIQFCQSSACRVAAQGDRAA